MKWFKGTSKGLVAATLAALLFPVAACVQDVGDIDRTQANSLSKEQFHGVWYYVKTVSDIPYSSAFTFQGETNFGNSAKVIFDVQEKLLVAYPILETVKGSEGKLVKQKIRRYWDKDRRDEFIEVYVSSPVAMWPITSHFDIKREYSTATGEQTNVISENTSDRPWYLRDYVRVDWGSEMVRETGFITGSASAQPVHYVQDWEANGLNPDAPTFEADYFDIVTKYFATPSYNACAAYGQAPGDCAGAIVKVRHSFKMALPDDDFITRVYTNREHQEKFGYFQAERHDYDHFDGVTESGRDYKAQLWNLWRKSQTFEPAFGKDGKPIACITNVDCDEGQRCVAEKWFEDGRCMVGTPLPYKERGLNPIMYHLSTSHPGLAPAMPELDEEGALVGWAGGRVVLSEGARKVVHPFIREAYEAADGWSDVFKETVAWLYFHEDLGLLRPADRALGARTCETSADCTGGRTDILHETSVDTSKEVKILCSTGADCNAYGGDCLPTAGSGGSCKTPGDCICGKTIACSVNSPCPYGMACKDGTCLDDGGLAAVEPIASVKNPRAYTVVLVDDGKGGVTSVRTTDGIFPATLGSNQSSVRFVNGTKDATVSLRAVLTDPAAKLGDAPKSEVPLFSNVAFSATAVADVPGHLDPKGDTSKHPYEVVEPATWRRLEVVDGSGKVLAKLNNVQVQAGKTYVFAFIGGDTVVKATSSISATAADRTQGVRFINGVKGVELLDIGLDAARIGTDSKFGDVGAYVLPAKRGINRILAVVAGVPGDVTCFHENSVGKCVGWSPRIDDAAEAKVADIKKALPEMFVLCEPIYSGDSCSDAQMGDMKQLNDCRYSTRNEDGTISNPCKDNVAHPGMLKKIGDSRYNQMYWVGEAQAASPLGYGPTAADPETGRSFWASSYIYGASLITYGQYAVDLINLMNGNLSVQDTISGKYVKDAIDAIKASRSPEDYTSLYEGLTLGSSASGSHATADGDTYDAEGDDAAVSGPNPLTAWSGDGQDLLGQVRTYGMSPKYRFRAMNNPLAAAQKSPLEIALEKLKGSRIEALLVNDEVKMTMSSGAILPGDPMDDQFADAVSPMNWLGTNALRQEQQRMALLTKSENCVYMPDFMDGAIYGLSKEIGCSAEAKKAGAQPVTSVSEAVALIDENLAATGQEVVPEGYCLEGEALHLVLTARIYGGVLEHEVGHTMGLRHNFAASNDIFNFDDKYYSIRERDAVRCLDVTGCNFARGEECYTACQADGDCAEGTLCVSGTCIDPEVGDPMGQCVAPAQVGLSKASCSPDLAKVKGGDLVPTWDAKAESCVLKGYCGLDGDCAEGQTCKSDRCEPASGVATFDPAVVSKCTTAGDCGEGGICADPGATGSTSCWKISKAIVSRGHQTLGEMEKRRTEYQLSTVMDYGQKINADIHGLGKYDYAAIKFGYGDLVEVYQDVSMLNDFTEKGAPYFGDTPLKFSSFTKDSSIWANTLYHPFFFLNYVITVDANLSSNRVTVPFQQVKLSRDMNYDYNSENYWDTYIEVPYDFCSDEYRGNGGCLYFDTGADSVEVTYHAMEMLTMYYIFDAFQRERFGFGWGNASYSYYARIMDRWMNPLRLSGLYFALYENRFAELNFWKNFSRQPMSGGYFRTSANMAYQFLHQLIASPAPGRYELDPETNTYVNVSYDTTPTDDEDTLVVPIGQGKFPWTTFDTSYGYYAFQHPLWAGAYWEKLAAMQTLTDASISFLSDYVGEALDIGVSSAIGFVTAYPRELTNLFGGVVADAWEQWAGVVEAEPKTGRLEYRPRSAFNPQAQSNMPLVQPSISTLSFKTLSAVVALATLPAGFDPSVTDSMAVVLEGNASDYQLAPGMEWKKFTDPFSNKTYLAIVPRYDANRLAVAARIVDQANALKTAWAAAATDVEAAMYASQLKELVEVLDVLRELNATLGVIRY